MTVYGHGATKQIMIIHVISHESGNDFNYINYSIILFTDIKLKVIFIGPLNFLAFTNV